MASIFIDGWHLHYLMWASDNLFIIVGGIMHKTIHQLWNCVLLFCILFLLTIVVIVCVAIVVYIMNILW